MIIMSSDGELEVGKVYNLPGAEPDGSLSDFDGIYRVDIPFLVLRVATREEYVQWHQEHGLQTTPNRCYHYAIHID